jgi:hypothetical protein
MSVGLNILIGLLVLCSIAAIVAAIYMYHKRNDMGALYQGLSDHFKQTKEDLRATQRKADKELMDFSQLRRSWSPATSSRERSKPLISNEELQQSPQDLDRAAKVRFL